MKQPHIGLSKEDAAVYAIMPGDPKRVDRVAEYLENVKSLTFNREYNSMMGTYKGVKILAISTGMGGASMGIAVEELAQIGVKVMIRIGSCGSLRTDITAGNLIVPNGAVRNDGASAAYIQKAYPAVPNTDVMNALINAAQEHKFSYHIGIVRSHESFYTDEEDNIDRYWAGKGIIGSDMESAALFVIGGLRNVKTASILNVVAEYEGDLKENILNYSNSSELPAQGEKAEIITALEACVRLEKNERRFDYYE